MSTSHITRYENVTLCDVGNSDCVSVVVSAADRVRFWGKVVQCENGCWEWSGNRTGSGGYGQFTYGPRAARVYVYAHRFVWAETHGAIAQNMLVLHTCDNPPCCNPAHLFLGDQFANMRDASAKGRLALPRRKFRATIAEIQARWLAGGITQRQLATEHGTTPTQITRWLKPVKSQPYERRRSA